MLNSFGSRAVCDAWKLRMSLFQRFSLAGHSAKGKLEMVYNTTSYSTSSLRVIRQARRRKGHGASRVSARRQAFGVSGLIRSDCG